MSMKAIKIVILNIFFLCAVQLAFSQENLLPIKKPVLSAEIIEKKISKNILIPLKKPILEQKEKITEIKKKKEEKKISKIQGVILPESKPLIVKKGRAKVSKKSKYYSERDFNYAKQAIQFMEKSNWKDALKVAKKARAKSIYNFIQWQHLLTTGNRASFYDYKEFIERNKNYPRIGRIKYLAEHKMSTQILSPKDIINWFENRKPLSGFGKMVLGESLILTGNNSEGIKLIKEGWITADLSKSDLKFFRKKYKKYLSSDDYIKRADYLAWENKYWDLRRMLRYLPKDYRLLYTARQLLMRKSYGVDSAISKVPQKLKNDPGLNYDRLKWRRKRGRLESSLEILLNIDNTKEYMVRPEKWWTERSIIARSLIYKKKYETAYKIASQHAMSQGPEFAEAEWISGWIAFSFLKDPLLAEEHFKRFYENVGYPISLTRGAYWLGRTYEKMGNKELSEKWYKEGAKYLTTYYGQLSHLKVYPYQKFALYNPMQVDIKISENFYRKKLVAIVHLLDDLKKEKYAKYILRFLANENINEGSEILAAKLATDISRFDFAIQISKIASYEKRFHHKYNYPIIGVPKNVKGRKIPDSAFILSIIRQESEFDTSANSSAGAKGLMQLMTYTARIVAKQAKIPYSKKKLTKNPKYNINLGSFYLAGLLLEYDGSYPFSIAAYNAGPKRVKYWNKINKNPQKGNIDYVDWIELIKFKETRNYVQRVLENFNVYRFILEQKPIKLKNFFKNDPLY
ncbi:MAG TPA: lytic transglycosylase domain-containing protein [Candidatus Pelagibacter sp.]|nr:lytic transglycosylase domain-containing protein [Candidatus Pelagibacter sp.]